MNMFLWIFREVFSFKNKALGRIISLALGMSIGLVLFSYNSYQLTYDDFQKQGDRIFRVGLLGRMNGEDYESAYTFAPLADALKQDFPEVEAATCVRVDWQKEMFRYEGNEFREVTLYADTAFFSFFSCSLVMGDQAALMDKNNIFISERIAKKVFGTEAAIGKRVWSEEKEWIVAGILADLPENTHLFYEVVKSLDVLNKYKGWDGGTSYYCYVRLTDPAAADKIEGHSRQFLGKYIHWELELELHLQPLKKLYLLYSGENVVERMVLLSVLALVMLLVSGLNYVLLSISSIGRRTKLIGIHKVNGAEGKDLYRMFMAETGILLTMAFVLSVVIILLFRTWTEQELGISLADLLTWQNLWVALLILGAMFFFSGFCPARLLASMSFMQIEHRMTEGARRWKIFLLGGQFMMVAFLLVLLWIVVGQTGILLNQDPGYDIERLYFTRVLDNQDVSPAFRLKEELDKLPFVEGVAVAESLPADGLSGIRVKNKTTDEEVVSARWLIVDEEFFEVMHIPVNGEKSIWKSGTGIVVNEKLLKLLHKEENPEDYIFAGELGYLPVDGICRDFQLGSLYNEQLPLLVSRIQRDEYYGSLNVIFRLTVVTPENIMAVKKVLTNTVSKQSAELLNYVDYMQGNYSSIFQLRRWVLGMAGVVLVIIVLGLIGYTSDEVNRKAKEIAIRKVNGAKTREVMELLLLKLGWIAMGGIPWGLAGAYWVGCQVLEGFVIKYSMDWWIFAGTVLFILVIMVVVVYICAYKVAAANPVKALQAE